MSQEKGKQQMVAKDWFVSIITAVLIAGIILCFVLPTVVKEQSMENTLRSGDYLLVSKMTSEYERGDIIVFRTDFTTETGVKKLFIKRVIAKGGDTVFIRNGYVFVNGEMLDEEYTKEGYTKGDMEEITVPEGKLFCMGDNRQHSTDSRDDRLGLIDEELVVGKAFVRLFPFTRIGRL